MARRSALVETGNTKKSCADFNTSASINYAGMSQPHTQQIMRIRLLFVFVVLLAACTSGEIELCGNENDLLKWKEIDFTPDILHPGDTVVINGAALLGAQLNQTTRVHVRLRLGLVKLLNRWFDFCPLFQRLAKDYEKQWPPSLPRSCPVDANEYNLRNQSIVLPSNTPPGRYQLELIIVTGESEPEQQQQVTCVTVRMTVKKSSSELLNRQRLNRHSRSKNQLFIQQQHQFHLF